MKSLTRTEAKTQVKRMMANAMLAPQTEDGSKELVDCLMRNCRDQPHAERAMTVFLDTAKDPRNVTAELATAAKSAGEAEVPPPGCPLCMADLMDGFYFLSHVVRTNARGVEFAGRCTCVRGRWLASRDLRRAKEQAAARDAVVTTAMQGGE